MRQAYLEIALIYLHSGGITMMKEGSSLEALSAVFSGSEEDLASVRTGRESMGSKKKYKVQNLDFEIYARLNCFCVFMTKLIF